MSARAQTPSGRGFPDYLTGEALPMWTYAEIASRLEHIGVMGVVAKADYAAGKVRVLVSRKTLTEWLPWFVPAAGGNVEWHPIDVGATVMIVSPSGNLNNGFVLPSVNKTRVPHQSASPDVEKKVWRVRKPDPEDSTKEEDDEESIRKLAERIDAEPKLDESLDEAVRYAGETRLMAVEEFNRRTAQYRRRLADIGSLCWEIHDFVRIFADKDKIELRVKGDEGTDESKSTKLVITKDDFAVFVKGRKTSLQMNETRVSLQVKNIDDEPVIVEEWNGEETEHMRRVKKPKGEHTFARQTHLKHELSVQEDGVFSLTQHTADIQLRSKRVRSSWTVQGFDTFVGSCALSLISTDSGNMFRAVVPGSRLTLLQDIALLESPLVLVNRARFEGKALLGEVFAAGPKPGDAFSAMQLRARDVVPLAFSSGNPPSMPEN